MDRDLAVVIPAGGGGTRLWPRSRKTAPKQFLDIVTPGRTMLQETVDRVLPLLTGPERLYVITNASHVERAQDQLPDTPALNIVGEPQGRDSAPAVGLMAALLEKQLGRDTIMAVLPADHIVLDPDSFQRAIEVASTAAKEGYLVTLGIPPTSPDTGFGYIRRGEEIGLSAPPLYAARQFKEKPDLQTAREYLATGVYFWNAGMFVGTIGHFRDLYQQYLPEMEPFFAELVDSYGSEAQSETFTRIFPQLTKISFDYAIAERATKVAVVPARIGWSDVGSWARLAEVLASQSDDDGNVIAGHHIGVDTKNSMIHATQKLVTTIGLDGLIIIDTPDALLIASKDRSEDVKRIVEQLHAEGKHELL